MCREGRGSQKCQFSPSPSTSLSIGRRNSVFAVRSPHVGDRRALLLLRRHLGHRGRRQHARHLRGGGENSEWTSQSHDSSHKLANMPFLGEIERLESC